MTVTLKLGLSAMIVLFVVGCTSYHQGVSSYEEVYSADNPSSFEFSHFKYFGSSNVLVVNEDKRIKRNLAELCSDYEMNCYKYTLELEAENVQEQMNIILSQIQKFQGETFLLVTDHADVTAAIVAKYAKTKYKDDNHEKIFRTFKAENTDIILPLIKN